ncbi:MAG: energy transducer TonB [Pseudomonadales bacterium]
MNFRYWSAAISIMLCLSTTYAQDADGDSEIIESYSDAVATNRVAPKYPSSAIRRGREGWVIVSYIVTKDGEIAHPMIEDSSGDEAFEKAAIDVLSKWDYEPALRNGEPVDQSLTKHRMTFKLEDSETGASRKFFRIYKRIDQLIADAEFEQAGDQLNDLQYSQKQNLYEDAWFWWLNYQYLNARGQAASKDAINSLRKAIGYEEVYLPTAVFTFALHKLYVAELKKQDYSAAIQTYERLRDSRTAKKSDAYESTIETLSPSYQQILEAVEGDQLLVFDAQIGSNDYWVHRLIRRSFSLNDIDGSLEVVDIRCPQHNRQFSISETSAWTIPESWGDCGVYIKGVEGTTFTFYAHPSEK